MANENYVTSMTRKHRKPKRRIPSDDSDDSIDTPKLEKFDKNAFAALLAEMFPSKYSRAKVKNSKPATKQYNIVFSIGPDKEKSSSDGIEEEDGDYTDCDDGEEEEEEECDDREGEEEEEEECDGREEEEEEEGDDREGDEECEEGDEEEEKDVSEEREGEDSEEVKLDTMKHVSEAKTYMEGLSEEQKANPYIQKTIKQMIKDEVKLKKQNEKRFLKIKNKNTETFKTLLSTKNVMNDVLYFQKKLSIEEQLNVIAQIKEINSVLELEKPYRLSLFDANIPIKFKACAYTKLCTLKNIEPGTGEYNKIKTWVDDFMRIPFNKFNKLPINIEDGIEKCHEFMKNAKDTLDRAVYGMNDVKLQVMQLVGKLISNPNSFGTSVAIEGPPGTGKTTIVKEGISKILNREFVFIPMGGATDGPYLEGHSYTYEGSKCGIIVKQLIQCKSMNPIIYFDELDKISGTPAGEEIVGILTHLTDTSQNSQFHDKYFAEFDFDLSKCLFFFSYNDRSRVNKVLLDRLNCIVTRRYEPIHKSIISKNYLIPAIREQVSFKETDIIIPDDTIHYIVSTHTNNEDGVRNLKRCLEIIHTKLNLYRLMRPDTNLFEVDMNIKVEFPIIITTSIVDALIKPNKECGSWQNMYL